MPKIDTMYAYIAEDEGPDDEGVTAMRVGDMLRPMVGADMARMESLRPLAMRIGEGGNKKITLCEFSNRKEIAKIWPKEEAQNAS